MTSVIETPKPESPEKSLPPPWDRIFSLGTRTFVWGLLLATLWLLSPFLLLIFLTFVFAYIQAHGVDGLEHRIKNRPLRVTIVGLVFLGTLFATGFTLAPQVNEEFNKFWGHRQEHIAEADAQLDKWLQQYPAIHEMFFRHQKMAESLPPPAATGNGGSGGEKGTEKPTQDPGGNQGGQEDPAKTTPDKPRKLTLIADLAARAGEVVGESSLAIGQSVVGYASAFLLSLLFSFLIVLDLPKIKRGVQALTNTKVGFIYDEVADNIAGFGRVLGRALEAQLIIAIVNTILTAIGIWFLGLPNLLVLATVVFFCSFIPVAGTFLSSTPICLVALQTPSGVTTMLIAIAMICIVHAIETYILNPLIYGQHMRMNPVVVLIVLTVGGKLFGVWGLLLGIPITNYIWRHAIRRTEEQPTD
ncbi:MAG: AI-2E family transporter [Planctomycetota bacterium]